jgi:hypothetical protein
MGQDVVEKYRAQAEEKWEDAIAKLEQLDAQQSDPERAILFIGSSSIRLWETISQDMQPYAAIRRGYGGAKFTDVGVFAERLIKPHAYRGLVVFAANDVTGKPADTPLDDIRELVMHIIATSRQHQPEAPVFLMEITPTPSRFDAWAKIRDVNAMMRDLALTEPRVYFISSAQHVLDDQKSPQPKLFRDDMLHLNQDGYQLWATIIKHSLDQFLDR